MRLKCVNLVSTDPVRLQAFYALVLGTSSAEIVPGCWELPAGEATLVITQTQTHTPVNPDCCGLEFVVDNVDTEYRRLLAAGVTTVRPPVTYPWGWRAVGLQDPDGNHIDLVQSVGNSLA